MTELLRYNPVPKIIGQDMNFELEAAEDGRYVQADNALTVIGELQLILRAAMHGLRSYEYGNDSTDLAKEMADKIETVLSPRAIAQGDER
jgi:hypothetical protein